jgi:hypothetical protein
VETSEHTEKEVVREPVPFLVELSVFIAAIIGRSPAMGAWWNQDDWGQIGRAAGMVGLDRPDSFPARWLSQHFWWDMTWPVFGLNSDAHALIRLILHGLCAVLVTLIGRRAGLGRLPRLVAGLLFAASPLAFTPLYWASGIQELLAGVFALLAVERWLAAGQSDSSSRRNLLLATGATIFSMLSKEAGLGLPLFFLVLMWMGIGVQLRDKAFAWAMVMFMLAAAVGEGVLVMNHFGADASGAYATGGVVRFITNICVYGWWLLSPWPILNSQLFWPKLVPGGMLFVVWLGWGIFQWRRGNHLVLLALVAALLALGPVLILKDHYLPYLAYLTEAAGALALVTLLPRRWPSRVPVLVALTLAATAWGVVGMEIRLQNRNELGLAADPVVRSTSYSWQACRILENLKFNQGRNPVTYVTIFQQPVSFASAAKAEQLGERWVEHSGIYNALHGDIGPKFILGSDITVTWVSGLTTAPPDAVVVSESGEGLRVWGRTWNALLYAALTDVGLGHFERARRHLVKAATMNEETIMFIYDEGQMIIPFQMVMKNKERFVDWTVQQLGRGSSPHEVGGVQDLFFNLLSNCTGRSIGDLTSGSRLLNGSDDEQNIPDGSTGSGNTEGD